MTWQELKNYIEQQSEQNDCFLNQIVKFYDYDEGEEYQADIIELLEERQKDQSSGWISYITIDSEVTNGKAQKASIT